MTIAVIGALIFEVSSPECPPFNEETIRAAVSSRENNHRNDGNLLVSSVSSSTPRPFGIYREEVFAQLDKREIYYTVTRLRCPMQTFSREDRHVIRHSLIAPTDSFRTVYRQT
ncbi:hypothetical protein TNCV_4731311 [Trichonephila clavipes]|nr:hypothetical protein TNCV_4731311 [Trichonephila clavipes]